MTREIILDTETTGMNPFEGDRIVEIGCVECINHLPTGRTCHLYINPERPMPAEAAAVHGLTDDFLKDKPVFAAVYADFLDFIGDSPLVIHNAEFDMRFINHHLAEMGAPAVDQKRIIDTLMIARQKFPGSPASLDALCKRFEIDNSARTLHGALLDAQILAEVYLELLGGRQTGLFMGGGGSGDARTAEAGGAGRNRKPFREPRDFPVADAERAAHDAMLDMLGPDALWRKLGGERGS